MLYYLFFLCLVGIFIFGITLLRIGLFNLSGKAMEIWLKKVTNTPIKGMFLGMFITPVLQSSGAVMVITVGLVGAGVLAFPQTIGIILGTNVGTTFTLEFLSFNLSVLIIPFIAIGFICFLLKKLKFKSLGFVFIGFALIFSAMRGFEWLAVPFTHLPFLQKFLFLLNDRIFYAFITGIVITACIQSSTVMTGIAMSFLSAQIFPLETGIAIMLGANIGSCITGLLASIGAGEEARLTAYAHIWLNAGGALLCLPFLHELSYLCKELSSNPETQLAHASVIFNLFSSLLILPIAPNFGRFIVRVHSKKKIIH